MCKNDVKYIKIIFLSCSNVLETFPSESTSKTNSGLVLAPIEARSEIQNIQIIKKILVFDNHLNLCVRVVN